MIPNRFVAVPVLFAASAFVACSQPESVVTMATRPLEMKVEGMTCTGCEGTISSTVLALEGIESCQASFATGKVLVVYKPMLTDEAKIAEAIRSVGYKVP